MGITKSSTDISGGTWQSGSTTTAGTSLAVSTTGDYADCLYLSIAVGATPTGGATFYVQQSPDGGTTWNSGPTYTSGIAVTTYYWQIALDPTCEKVQVVWVPQTGGGTSTINIKLGQVTAV